jgi:hypothetical protein
LVEVARLVLDYVQALIWPALVVFVVVRFRRPVGQFLGRIAGESQEFSAAGFGLEITARFQERLATLAEQSETADPAELRESVKDAAREFGHDQFRVLTSNFLKLPLRTRQEVAREIANVARTMELDDILQFARSPRGGERLGAAIGLRVHLQRFEPTQRDPRLRATIRDLIGDRFSLVRYRGAEALRAAPQLASELADDLSGLAESDDNLDVRDMARKALARAEG